MRIAQVAPLYEPVPPRLYGGTERVVSYLTEELVRRGHDVTLFASGDSQTAARLVAVTEHALRLDGQSREVLAAGFAIALVELLRFPRGSVWVVVGAAALLLFLLRVVGRP